MMNDALNSEADSLILKLDSFLLKLAGYVNSLGEQIDRAYVEEDVNYIHSLRNDLETSLSKQDLFEALRACNRMHLIGKGLTDRSWATDESWVDQEASLIMKFAGILGRNLVDRLGGVEAVYGSA